MYAATQPPARGKWAKLFARRRNWLLIWRMMEKKLNAKELAEKAGVSTKLVLRLMGVPGSVPNETAMKALCQALQANPHDLGWARKMKGLHPSHAKDMHTPFSVDLVPFYDAIDCLHRYSIFLTRQLELVQGKLDRIYRDYKDQMEVDVNSAPEPEKDVADPFLEAGEKIKEVLSDEPDVDNW